MKKHIYILIVFHIQFIVAFGQINFENSETTNWNKKINSGDFNSVFWFLVECKNDSLFRIAADRLNKYLLNEKCRAFTFEEYYDLNRDSVITDKLKYDFICENTIEFKYINMIDVVLDSSFNYILTYLDERISNDCFEEGFFEPNSLVYKNSETYKKQFNGKEIQVKRILTNISCNFKQLHNYSYDEWKFLVESIKRIKQEYSRLREKKANELFDNKSFNDLCEENKKLIYTYIPTSITIHLYKCFYCFYHISNVKKYNIQTVFDSCFTIPLLNNMIEKSDTIYFSGSFQPESPLYKKRYFINNVPLFYSGDNDCDLFIERINIEYNDVLFEVRIKNKRYQFGVKEDRYERMRYFVNEVKQ